MRATYKPHLEFLQYDDIGHAGCGLRCLGELLLGRVALHG